jgi:hypothetical protein
VTRTPSSDYEVKTLIAGTRLDLETAVAEFKVSQVGVVRSVLLSIPASSRAPSAVTGSFPACRAWIVYHPYDA